jgi:hypothetical protein
MGGGGDGHRKPATKRKPLMPAEISRMNPSDWDIRREARRWTAEKNWSTEGSD